MLTNKLKLLGGIWEDCYFRCVSLALHNASYIGYKCKLPSCRIYLE